MRLVAYNYLVSGLFAPFQNYLQVDLSNYGWLIQANGDSGTYGNSGEFGNFLFPVICKNLLNLMHLVKEGSHQ